MKLTKALILIAGLGLAAGSAYADHRGGNHVEARYQYHNNGSHHGHNKYYKKHYKHGYDNRYNSYYDGFHNDRHEKHYYVRHVHSRHCGHHYEPAFNTRVNVFLGL
ncbi:MAG: hypothetical protein KKF24_14995 [Gammaproteobacteria bacterium]|nr:hypothetical protein [Gammaproteobacteria bacterium]MBU1833989.1 hypothetical protein [Gammaproteobacteria bacterium]